MTSEPRTIFLFDLDGVLLRSRGYREAIRETCQIFTRSWGLGALHPEESTVVLLESLGITSEWDIVPLYLAEVLESWLEAHPGATLEPDWTVAGSAVTTDPVLARPPAPDEAIRRVGGHLHLAPVPSEVVLAMPPEAAPFPHLAQQPFIHQLFGATRSVQHSPATRLFQNLVLGDQVFKSVYPMMPDVESTSYLEEYDEVLLSGEMRGRLLEGNQKMAILTARPSLAPEGTRMAGCSPEAELALKMVGLDRVPLMAYGKMIYAAQQWQTEADALLKPFPFQALAACLCALGVPELEALTLAGKLALVKKTNREEALLLSGLFQTPLHLHIFEDTPIGILAVQSAAELLGEMGVTVTVKAWGIATQPAKRAALEGLGAALFPHVDQALDAALAMVN
ncbi:MAG TPA: hypothetical protein PKW33_00260 [Anaerolineaceae bacterium]|nr:hypothetical protein [Anaerolineaceae bacterium]HPN49989.1 hypothetical protein [Anaerolineaceae bacterium]